MNKAYISGNTLLVESSSTSQCAIAFIDRNIPDYEFLTQGAIAGSEVILLDPDADGVQQITAVLAGRVGVTSIHLVSHGMPGQIQLGNVDLTIETINRYAVDFQQWAIALAQKAELVIYGCEVAQGKLGKSLIWQLSELTGATVTASDTKTGSDAFGGDWNFAVNHPIFGVDANKNGIADKIVYQYDFADNDGDASDKNNHGSHIASIFSSVAPNSNIIALKVFKDSGAGSFSYLEKALQWVAANSNKYNIGSVNLSIGDSQNWTTTTSRYGIGDELAASASKNIIINAAAGNNFYQYGSTPGLAYPAVDANVIAVDAVWTDNFGGPKTFVGGATDYTTSIDQIASFSQRDPNLLGVFAPGILITGANANGGTVTLGGSSQASGYITGVATLAQQLAQEKLGRKLTVSEFRNLLLTKSVTINDGDNENDNVTNTGKNYPRVDLLKLAAGILNLNNSTTNSNPVNSGTSSNNNSTTTSDSTPNLVHTVNLSAGEVSTGIDFGNQQIIGNQAPTLGSAIADQNATEDANFTFTIPENTFTDADAGDVLTYSATLENGDALPSWLTFDVATRTFSGTPKNSEVGSLNIKVTATDQAGATATDSFAITVANTNDAPILGSAIADQTATSNSLFSFTVPANSFTDVDNGDILSYTATLENGSSLPAWLKFDPVTRSFSGTPSLTDVGTLNIKVQATDSNNASASDIFAINITNISSNITGTSGNDVIKGTANNDNIQGLSGNDQLFGLGGNDTLNGSGNDTMTVNKV